MEDNKEVIKQEGSTEISENNQIVETIPTETKEFKRHSVPILKIIKTAQSQHGLRHNSYNNYRNYCSRKLRRVKKALRFKNIQKEKKKEKYLKREITATHCQQKYEYLLIPLFSAERAWAHAMEMKENNSGEKREKHHIKRKFSKAAAQSKLLLTLAQSCSDDKTQLEIQAYNFWMQGIFGLESKTWQEALSNLLSSKKLFGQLKTVGDKEFQTICEQRLSSLETSLRFCNYNINNSSSKSTTPSTTSTNSSSESQQVSESQIKSVLEQNKVEQTQTLKEITFNGQQIAIKSEEIKSKIVQLQQIKLQIQNESSLISKIKLADSLFGTYEEAHQAVNDYFEKQAKTKKQKEGKSSQKKELLNSYLTQNQILDTIERNLFLIKLAEKRIQSVQDEDTKSEEITSFLGSHSKHSDVAKLYSNIIHNINQFKSLLDKTQVEQIKLYTSKVLSYQCFQYFWLALNFGFSKQFPNALSLFNYTQQQIGIALQHHQSCATPSSDDIKALNLLSQQIRSEKSILRANNFISQQSSETISEQDHSNVDNLPLLQRLFSFSSQSELFLTSIPPSPSAIPTKPVSFDLALVKCQFPILEERKKKKKTGFWSWFG